MQDAKLSAEKIDRYRSFNWMGVNIVNLTKI